MRISAPILLLEYWTSPGFSFEASKECSALFFYGSDTGDERRVLAGALPTSYLALLLFVREGEGEQGNMRYPPGACSSCNTSALGGHVICTALGSSDKMSRLFLTSRMPFLSCIVLRPQSAGELLLAILVAVNVVPFDPI